MKKLSYFFLLLLLCTEVIAQRNCSDLVAKNVDKFNGAVTYKTSTTRRVSFLKITDNGISGIYIYAEAPSSSLKVGEKGAVFLLEDGTKISIPEAQIEVKPSRNGQSYIYNTMHRLSDEEVNLLRKKKITDIRLYIFDAELFPPDAEAAIAGLNCLVDVR